MAPRLLRRSLGDPFVRLQLITAVAVALLYVLPILSHDALTTFSNRWLCPVLLVWPLIGSWVGANRLPVIERRAWRALGVGVAFWLAALLLSILRPIDATLYLFYYLCMFLGLDGLANAESGRRRTTLERRLRLAGVVVFLTGWAVYARLYAALPTTSQADSQMSVVMGLAILGLATWRWRYGATARGRTIAGAFAVASAALLVSDTLNLLIQMRVVTLGPRLWTDVFWALPGLALVVAMRSGHHAAPPDPLGDLEREQTRTPIALGTALMFGGFSFPVVHGLMRVSSPGTITASSDIVAFQTVVIGASLTMALLAAMAHWLLERESDALRTAHLALTARLDEAQKFEALGRLAGGVAHDFNNLLTVIGASSELLDKEPLSEVGREMLQMNRAAVDRAAALTRQLLIFSRHNVSTTGVVAVDDTIGALQGLMTRLIGERVAVRATLAAPGCRTRINASQFEQVVTNLVVNARDAMPSGGLIMIHTAPVDVTAGSVPGLAPGRYVRLRVSDTGPGIPADVRPHLFEPFFSTKSTDMGRGVGLATAHGIVTQYGGAFEVDSTPGQGATFTFYLPVTNDRADTPAATAPAPNGRETVLVVEDDHDVRLLVSEMLRAKGYAVIDAPGPEAALQIVRGHAGTIHLLLTDVVMPLMSGVELSKHVRDLRPGIRVLYMSGYPDEGLIREGLTRDRADFLAKPVTLDVLSSKVRALLDEQ